MSEPCACDWETGECQGPLGCKAVAEVLRLQAALRTAVIASGSNVHPNEVWDGIRRALEEKT